MPLSLSKSMEYLLETEPGQRPPMSSDIFWSRLEWLMTDCAHGSCHCVPAMASRCIRSSHMRADDSNFMAAAVLVRVTDRDAGHSIFTPANFTTSAHFFPSDAMKAAKSCGEPMSGVEPSLASAALMAADRKPSLAAALSRVTI